MDFSTILLIGAFLGAIIGFAVGFTWRREEDEASAVWFGLLGAIIGVVGGAFLLGLAVVVGVLYLMLIALTHMS